mmetsp:Transcript_32210/g.85116  ORF Transcript_32210/g.85116 Transcript_32210/m.85116 type:complete len:577 (+) Transcript_32210:82-1812(+)|eukprot:CAMPEP_0115458046 /NCGR_PEP_ID=MMETSP0271-20121206/45529_1 /TAXON_ID=71861 /ORGANISM="Scrippsiella trochoidea, Strain CCMP3099" /LENGTH=576 /DNA_ID=CAMNT_0002884635 /DNA_START=50 /DNA_END=1780 /DNA_ORIENTATION=-
MDNLAAIERRLTGAGSESHLNEVESLYGFCESEDLRVVAEALKAIGRVLAHHRCGLRSSADSGTEATLGQWLRQHTEAYHATLVRLATSASPRAQVCAVRLAMAAVQGEAAEVRGAAAGRSAVVLPPPEQRVQNLISELLLDTRWSDVVAQCLADEFVKQYVDMRHYVVCHLRYCAEQVGKVDWDAKDADASAPTSKRRRGPRAPLFVEAMRSRGRSPEELFARVLAILKEAPEPDDNAGREGTGETDDISAASVFAPTGRPVGFFLREYRKVFQDAWLQLLGLHVPLDQCTPLLQLLPNRVMPHISQPLMLADFYLRAFDSGSTEVSMLSLSGLLFLLTKYGLGDPETLSAKGQEYYAQLYSLVKLDTFALRKRARFQRLLAASLESGLLPARFAAVFAKRCLHVAVACSDPGTVMWLMAVAYSLIQKHHSHCKYLLHKEREANALAEPMPTRDAFDPGAPLDEAVKQVAESSLWELQLLRRHHISAISTLAKLFLRPFFKPTSRKLDPELFLDQSFDKMYQQAMRTGERQAVRLKSRGEKCPVAFKVEDDEVAAQVLGWAAALSTSQRQVGAGL